MRQMYFKRAKIFLEQTDKGEQRFIASVGGPVQVPNWVCKTLGYSLGVKDGSIVDITPPKVVAPVVEEDVPETQEAFAQGGPLPPVDTADPGTDSDPASEESEEDEAEEPEAEKAPTPKKPSRAGKGSIR